MLNVEQKYYYTHARARYDKIWGCARKFAPHLRTPKK